MPILTRRDFLSTAGSCAAHLALASALAPVLSRQLWAATPAGPVVAREPFGRLERIGEGVWALISTPFGGDRTTIANGGLILGSEGVLAIEGFNTPEGARWLAEQSRTLTGEYPTHVVVTHYHADHSSGISGYTVPGCRPSVRITEPSREMILARNKPTEVTKERLAGALVLSATEPSVIDLGKRSVRVVPTVGHTTSDCALHLDSAGIVFGGDLLWNGIFPNYVDAAPSQLLRAAQALRSSGASTFVPGHGSVATAADMDRYLALLQEVEHGTRAAYAKGIPAAEGAAAFTLSPTLGEWTLFNKVFFERAFTAWYKELAPVPRP